MPRTPPASIPARTTLLLPLATFAALQLLAACAHTRDESRAPTPPPPEPVEPSASIPLPEDSPQLRALMSEHFGFATTARNALIRGNLPAVRDALTQLADYPYTEAVVPPAWLPRIAALQRDAKQIAARSEIAELARGIASLAQGCGDCHEASGGGIAASVVARDPSNRPDTLPDRMFRHERAAEQMWIGLVAPSDEAWNAGARGLANASIEVEVHGDPPPSFTRALHYVRFLGAAAERATTRADRARVYANLLNACASCHHTDGGPVR